MTAFNRHDVVIVPFPFVDIPVQKARPALALSSQKFNEDNAHTILAMITTAARSHWPSDHVILDLELSGLNVDSLIRWKVFTLENRLISRRIGELGVEDRRLVEEVLLPQIFIQSER